jgi:hypothetical protein
MISNLLKLLIMAGLVLKITSITATTFIETSIESRLEQATGVVRGHFIGSTFKKNPLGRVVTEATFRVSAIAGIEPHQIINRNTFKITYPGGEWNGLTYKVSGIPTFRTNEEVVLIVSKGKFGYILPNLALSKFTISLDDEGKSEILTSSIFSEKAGIGRISFAELKKMSAKRFGTPLVSFNDKHIHIDRTYASAAQNPLLYDYKGRDGRSLKNRKPASFEKDEEGNVPILWFILALGFLGFLSNFILRGKEER